MIVLVDTDILIDIVLKRMPWALTSRDCMDYCQAHAIPTYVSWHSLATLFYYASGEGRAAAKEAIRELLQHTRIVTVGHVDMEFALDQDMPDLEDAMQVAAAVACRATRIVTRNTRHYARSVIPAITPAELLRAFRATKGTS
ncbi:MAG TPA: PIN domain-containing protein [Planctomycetota bacterium]|nr:PIN domain-containing protein [Planctomycetota bacterium]HRR79439.1 PIN domain-containing protein [Planctomycetota bacterium]HRT95484.1 PIN domain-containing protein [Planctomycetota bacterium]